MSKESKTYKNMSKKIYIRTFGCQMNEHDSGRLKDLLLEQGHIFCQRPEYADIIIFNTCSVRKHAEDRVYGKVGTLEALKRKKSGLIVGIIGCMAEAQKDAIFRKLPVVDFLCGPADLDRIPEVIEKIKNGAGRLMYLEGYKSNRIPGFSKDRAIGKTTYVKIMEGCDNLCSYCIVPYVRGRERSRPSKEIIDELKQLIDKGVKEITLLGQNVNSYGRGLKERIGFVGLLKEIERLLHKSMDNIRINFLTSHPKDAGLTLFKTMNKLKFISKNLHLPIQSGSNKILKAMNRGYTVEGYKKLAEDFRRIVKNGYISTDIIVGFPGETEKDFNDTLKIMKDIGFGAAYIFKYSPRPFTKASRLKDDVPIEEKERRHALLLETQKKISLNKIKCE